MKLVTAEISIPDEIVDRLNERVLIYLCNSIQEYIEEAIEDLNFTQWDRDLKVTFEQ